MTSVSYYNNDSSKDMLSKSRLNELGASFSNLHQSNNTGSIPKIL